MPAKLTSQELAAIYFIERDGPICPGTATGEAAQIVTGVLNSLVRKKRAEIEETDDGPRYHLTVMGRAEARK